MTPDQEFKKTFGKLFAPVNVRERREAELAKRVSELPLLQKAAGLVAQLADVRRRIEVLEKQAMAMRLAPPPSLARH